MPADRLRDAGGDVLLQFLYRERIWRVRVFHAPGPVDGGHGERAPREQKRQSKSEQEERQAEQPGGAPPSGRPPGVRCGL